MTKTEQEALDTVCRALQREARARGLNGIAIEVRQDGRVEIELCADFDGQRVIRADVLPGGSYPLPSAAFSEAM